MVTITVEIVSDIVCLWCFIGKRALERAVALYQKTYPGGKHDTFEILWRPYYLNYNRFTTSTQSVDKAEISKVKFKDVSEEKMAAMSNRVHQIARANGIAFKFGGKIGSTKDAHRLIHLSQQTACAEVQDALAEHLFKAYHENEADISHHEVLEEIAINAGLDPEEVRKWLSSDVMKEEVDAEAEKNRQLAPTGVPTFYVQSEHRVDGAQDLQEFFEVFIKVKEAEQVT